MTGHLFVSNPAGQPHSHSCRAGPTLTFVRFDDLAFKFPHQMRLFFTYQAFALHIPLVAAFGPFLLLQLMLDKGGVL